VLLYVARRIAAVIWRLSYAMDMGGMTWGRSQQDWMRLTVSCPSISGLCAQVQSIVTVWTATEHIIGTVGSRFGTYNFQRVVYCPVARGRSEQHCLSQQQTWLSLHNLDTLTRCEQEVLLTGLDDLNRSELSNTPTMNGKHL